MRKNGHFHKQCFSLAKIATIIIAGILFSGYGELIAVADTVSGQTLVDSDAELFGQENIIWEGLSELTTQEIKKWLSLPTEEQKKIKTEITKFWDSHEALPMPVFDKKVVRGMLAYYENVNLRKYRDELTRKGCEDPVWNLWTARLLRAYDESEGVTGWGDPDKFQNYTDRDEIIRIGVEQDITNIVLNGKGEPGIFLVNCEGETECIGNAFRDVIDFYGENGVEDIVDVLNYNGFYLFSPINTGRNALMGTYDRFNCLYMIYTDNRLKKTPDNVLFNFIRRLPYLESVGISYLRLVNVLGVFKSKFLSETMKGSKGNEVFEDLYNKTNNEDYHEIAEFYLADAKSAARDFFKTLDDEKFVESVKFMEYYEISKSLGGEKSNSVD